MKKAKVNWALDLIKMNQPVYYSTTYDFSYESGKAFGKDCFDIIRLNTEHGPFDLRGIKAFIEGLSETYDNEFGYPLPTIMAEMPYPGRSAEIVEANSWMSNQLLALGVQALLLCHASSPAAVNMFVRTATYLSENINGIIGLRGYGGQEPASKVWQVSPEKYVRLAAPWPLKPKGELLLGIKLETKECLPLCHETSSNKGITFSEWGPGDMGMSFGYPENHDPPYPNEMKEAMAMVWNSAKSTGLLFLNQVYMDDYKELLDQGIMICKPDSRTTFEAATEYTMRNKKLKKEFC